MPRTKVTPVSKIKYEQKEQIAAARGRRKEVFFDKKPKLKNYTNQNDIKIEIVESKCCCIIS